MDKCILFLIAAVVTSGIDAIPALPGQNVKFKLLSAIVTGVPNEYILNAEANIYTDGFAVDIRTNVIKVIPLSLMVKVYINYNGIDIEPMDLEACKAFYEPFFVKDVVEKGEPKGLYPTKCPIPVGDLMVRNYTVPHNKIPPGTLPGPVNITVILYIPDIGTIEHIQAIGELVLDSSNKPSLPGLGK